MTSSGAELLRNAIIKQACNDYINAYRINRRGYEANALRKFFKSEWCKELMQNNDYNPDSFIKLLEVKSDYEAWRKAIGCGHCMDKTCPHSARAKRDGLSKYDIRTFVLCQPICKKMLIRFNKRRMNDE